MIKQGLKFNHKFQQNIDEVYEVQDLSENDDDGLFYAKNLIRPDIVQSFTEKQILDNLV